MRMDWLPVSAALLVTGALALCLGAFLLPASEDTSDALRIVEQQGGRWLAAAVIFFISSIGLTLGLPAVLSLFDRRGWVLGMISGIVLEIGFIGTAGFAMLMAFFRSLVISDALRGSNVDHIAHDAGLAVFLYTWIAGLYLGELLLGLALLRARTVPRWVPVMLILHALSFPVSGALPEYLSKATILLLLLGFAGTAIHAASPQRQSRQR
ncbi:MULTISPECIES: hypothetical protein [unclassified Nocardioides]|uniref:hypothetical protein n=1 Tax=unclassified Nocardioides TaxID=2615069 RepID=UPI0002F2E5D3|nr:MULTISPECIES: hypothetical protein [unclassified Nocardioides]